MLNERKCDWCSNLSRIYIYVVNALLMMPVIIIYLILLYRMLNSVENSFILPELRSMCWCRKVRSLNITPQEKKRIA
jgi:hypothetical protein